MEMPFTIRRLSRSDAEAWRDLRLEGLRTHPEAFGASWEEEAARPLDWFAERLETSRVFGGFSTDAVLMGTIALATSQSPKKKHKGLLWGVFVRPQARGSGLAGALLARVLEDARSIVEDVTLTVEVSNESALRLYARAGFVQYGLEKRALKIGTQYHDEILMAVSLK